MALLVAGHAVRPALSRGLPELTRPSREDVEEFLRDPPRALLNYLAALAARAPAPLVLLLDEADALVGASMVLFLTQLREGYIARSQKAFPASVVLIGQRQVGDYTLSTEERIAVS